MLMLWITGSGIGEACALAFAKEGAAGIVLADINLNDAEQVVMACEALATSADFKAKAVYVNIIQEALVEQTIAQTVELFGRIDYCVNCAGVSGCFDLWIDFLNLGLDCFCPFFLQL